MPRSRIGAIATAVVLYALLIVPPFAGLLAILHLGERLAAPHAIGGDWQVAVDGGAVGAACERAAADHALTLHVSQSGERAQATLSGARSATLALELRGDRISGAGRDSPAACQRITLDAQLTAGALVGVLRHPGCARCPDLPFHASLASSR